jgi:hypothetical protein
MTANQLLPPETALSPGDLYMQCFAREKNVLNSALSRIRLYKLLFIERPGLPPADRDEILAMLRSAPDKETLWELIARWLKQENICEPEEILPFSLNHLASKRLRGLSIKDTAYASVVEIWGPYFIRLMGDIEKAGELTHLKKSQLKAKGYNLEVIESTVGKDSPIEAICDWLEGRELFPGKDARTIRNAHSRCFGGAHASTSVFRDFAGFGRPRSFAHKL